MNQHLATAKDLVDAYLSGRDDASLQRSAMKLAMLETGSFAHALGWNQSVAAARYNFGAAPCADDLRDHASRKRMLESIADLRPLPWLETLQRIAALPSLQPIDWAISDIAKQAGVVAPAGSELYEAIGRAFLDRLCAACVVRIEPGRTRLIPTPIIVQGFNQELASSSPALAPAADVPTLTKVFEAWATFRPRELKLVDEWRRAIARFVTLNGDLPVNKITTSMIRDYRRTCSALPSKAPVRIAYLPLREQVELAQADGLNTLAPGTVNKALSALRVTLEHAVEELEVITENVAAKVKSVPTGTIEDSRLPFEPADMKTIYSAPLPAKDGVSPLTLFWVLFLAPFTGCRLEELGCIDIQRNC